MGYPCGSTGKEYACNMLDLGSIPGLERSPGEGKGYPFQYSGLENSMDCIVHGVAKNQTWLSNFHFHLLLCQLQTFPLIVSILVYFWMNVCVCLYVIYIKHVFYISEINNMNWLTWLWRLARQVWNVEGRPPGRAGWRLCSRSWQYSLQAEFPLSQGTFKEFLLSQQTPQTWGLWPSQVDT